MTLRDVPQDEDDFRKNLRLDSIRALIGDEETMRLLEKFGGTRIFIPNHVQSKRAGKPSKILQFLSYESAIKLSQVFGGLAYDIPLARNFRISYYRARGEKPVIIAQKVGLSRSAVWKAIKRLRLGTQPPMKRAA